MTGRLRVGVDAHNLLHDRRGIGRYARALLGRWAAADRVSLTLLVPHLFPALKFSRLAKEIGSDRFRVARRASAARLGLDLVWYPWNGMTWLAPGPKIATVHDVWPFVEPSSDQRIRRNEQAPFRATAANAARIITDSHFSKSEIVRHLQVEPDRIVVVHLGVDLDMASTAGAPRALRLVGPYVLFVGEAEGRKDVATLVAGMEKLPPPLRQKTALVIAGRPSRNSSLEKTGVRVVWTGEVGDDDLHRLYAGAAAFAFPSRYEGFGLPVLEAMAAGVPVIASDAASIPEAGGDAVVYFSAGDSGELSAALERVLTDEALAQRLRIAGRTRAALMSWDRCADATLAVFQEVANVVREL